jgi:hypothetical protein
LWFVRTCWVCSPQPQQGCVRRLGKTKGESTGLFIVNSDRGRSLGLLTSLADRLFATGESEGVEGQSATDGASKLDRNLVLRQRAVVQLAKLDRYAKANATDLISSS